MPHPKTVTTPEPSLGLILHAHLPAVPTGEFDAPEAVWFYQVLAESYIPVLERLARLAREGVAFRVTMHWSPVVRSALGDAQVHRGFIAWLESQIDITEGDTRAQRISILKTFTHDWREDVAAQWQALAASGHIEIMAGSATHAFLPLLAHHPGLLRAQIALGRAEAPGAHGFWLPEAACSPPVATALRAAGIGWTVIDDGSAGPFITSEGLVAFPVARNLSAMIAESPMPEAGAFLSALNNFAIVPIEIEALGHCWPGGIDFLEALLRNADTRTPTDFLADCPRLPQRELPSLTPVDGDAFADTWLNEGNAWLYPEIAETARAWHASAQGASPELPRVSSALSQAAREVLLCQFSDWPLFITADPKGLGHLAEDRLREHLRAARALAEQALAGNVSEEFLASRECAHSLFPNLDWRALRDAV
jgi:predicted glycosyl hydrolase (DUF1957 family)